MYLTVSLFCLNVLLFESQCQFGSNVCCCSFDNCTANDKVSNLVDDVDFVSTMAIQNKVVMHVNSVLSALAIVNHARIKSIELDSSVHNM
jgi:hypothetical protein